MVQAPTFPPKGMKKPPPPPPPPPPRGEDVVHTVNVRVEIVHKR